MQGLPLTLMRCHFDGKCLRSLMTTMFFPSLTVREHLLLIARGHSLQNPEGLVDDELAFFGLTGRLRTRASP